DLVSRWTSAVARDWRDWPKGSGKGWRDSRQRTEPVVQWATLGTYCPPFAIIDPTASIVASRALSERMEGSKTHPAPMSIFAIILFLLAISQAYWAVRGYRLASRLIRDRGRRILVCGAAAAVYAA